MDSHSPCHSLTSHSTYEDAPSSTDRRNFFVLARFRLIFFSGLAAFHSSQAFAESRAARFAPCRRFMISGTTHGKLQNLKFSCGLTSQKRPV